LKIISKSWFIKKQVRVFGDQILNQHLSSNELFAPLLMKGSGGRERKYFSFNKGQNVISKKKLILAMVEQLMSFFLKTENILLKNQRKNGLIWRSLHF
jgi:hypothetical protein